MKKAKTNTYKKIAKTWALSKVAKAVLTNKKEHRPKHLLIKYCPICKKNVPLIKKKTNHILHILLTILTKGYWAIVWLFIAFCNEDEHQCINCGYSKFKRK